jgi:hypothetical protein
MIKNPSKKLSKEKLSKESPNFTKPVWGDVIWKCHAKIATSTVRISTLSLALNVTPATKQFP